MRRIINGICVALGFAFLGIGLIGVAIPLLPTTPFLLMAAALFAKGSEKFHRWFAATRLYKRYIEKTIKQKEMTKKAKVSVLSTISILFFIGFLFAPIWHAKAAIILIALFHYYYFLFRIKTVQESETTHH